MRDELRRLHRAAGSPGKTALKHHADARGHTVGVSTLIAVVSPTARGRLRRATVAAFVDACVSYADRHGHRLTEPDRDRARWLVLFDQADAEPAAPDRHFAAERLAYLNRLRERFGRIDTETLLPLIDQEEPAPMLLREVFVPQHVRTDPPPLELPRELLRQLIEADEIKPDGLPAHLDPERLATAREAYRQRPSRPVLDVLAGPGGRRAVLLGDPGAGKSTLARYLALTRADHDATLPILIELRAVAAQPDETFFDLIDRQHAQDGLGFPRVELERYLRRGGSALVIFDGLDEVFDPRLRQGVVDRITCFAARYPHVQVLVTSRLIGYRRAPFDAAGFAQHVLQDLDDAQVELFARGWYRSCQPHHPAEADRLSRRLIDAVGASRAVRELAGNPLLLTVLAIIGRRHELPRDRRTAYEHAVTVLVEHWEVNKSLAAAEQSLPRLDREDKLELLRLLARHMQAAEDGPAGNHITGAELLRQFHDYLANEFGLRPGPARVAARAMLEQFRERNFILSRFGGEIYGFVHRAVLEYLVAADVVKRFDDRRLSEDDLIGLFAAHWRDPAWHEILLLIAGMKEHFAGRIIEALLDADPEWVSGPEPIPHHVLLAIRCLGEVRKVGLLNGQSEAVAAALTRALEVADHRGDPLPSAIERVVRPTFEVLGSRWAGCGAYGDWYRARGHLSSSTRRSVVGQDTASVAARLGAALLREDAGFHRLMRDQAQNHPASFARRAALSALTVGWPAEPATRDLLHSRAKTDPSDAVRQAALHLIAETWPSEPDSREWVLARAQNDPQEEVRWRALRLVVERWPDHPDTRTLLLNEALTSRDEECQFFAIEALARGWPDPEVHQLVHSCTRLWRRRSELAARGAAALAIGWPDDPDTHAILVEMVHDPDPMVREIAIGALGSCGSDRDEAREILCGRAVKELSTSARCEAVRRLAAGWSGHAGVREVVSDRLIFDNSATVRVVALRALVEHWPEHPETRLLVRGHALNDRNADRRQYAIEMFARQWRDDPVTLPWLLDLAADTGDRHGATAAVNSLVRHWPRDPAVHAVVSTHLSDRRADVRANAVRCVAKCRTAFPDAQRLLHTLAGSDRDGRVRRAAVDALAAMWPDKPETATEIRRRALADTDLWTRRQALDHLTRMDFSEPQTVEVLRRSVTSDDAETRRLAVTALVILDPAGENARGLLQRQAADPLPEIRSAALEALAQGWRDHPDTLPLIGRQAVEDVDDNVRLVAVGLLATVWPGRPAAWNILRRCATDLRADEPLRRAAQSGLMSEAAPCRDKARPRR
jgi:HEAT repeat protein